MILCDREVEAALVQGRIVITPRPDPKFLSSTTLDLRLADTLSRWEFPVPDKDLGHTENRFYPGSPDFKYGPLEEKYAKPIRIPDEGYVLEPLFKSTDKASHFILGYTVKLLYIPHTSRLCARVEGRSSLGRMGLGVHVTAPTIHAGFGHDPNPEGNHGAQLRLEMWNVGPLPIVLHVGMRICQLIIEEVREMPTAGYSGEFNRQGPPPVPNKAQTRKKGKR